ncbi:hypothetical protein HNQ79_001214 [Streptomyces candidus]|uniref:DUF2637 domain-containing protein n=2 Tax=Streptomyces candidus TaxID=67283 RepID=A0A7X0HBU9_9ACTN|nr:DUF2637 domain-containing protein [Streptomyces candidus]MBB6434763.1 hypothetical protein [Streptomyces candidus]
MQLTRTHRILIGVVVAGAVIIAGIGFAGSYAAVRELALEKGFGNFSYVFPVGIDAGICVLLALDLLLTWMRIPFPLLRQTAWLLTAATIAFNGAASWPDPLGVGMHAVIPILFVVSVEAARHAVGRIADITADKHMEGVRLTRWLLSPLPTFKLWRRMKLWELRSYEQVIKLEQDRLIYRARLQARYGRSWKRKAPVEALMPLRLAKIGVPLSETAALGLAAAGIEPALLPAAPTGAAEPVSAPALPSSPQVREEEPAQQPSPTARTGASEAPQAPQVPQVPKAPGAQQVPKAPGAQQAPEAPHASGAPQAPGATHPTGVPQAPGVPQGPEAPQAPQPQPPRANLVKEPQVQAPEGPENAAEQVPAHPSPWFAAGPVGHAQPEHGEQRTYDEQAGHAEQAVYEQGVYEQGPQGRPERAAQDRPPVMVPDGPHRSRPLGGYNPDYDPEFGPDFASAEADFVLDDDTYYEAFRRCAGMNGAFPTPLQFGAYLEEAYGKQLPLDELELYTKRYEERHRLESDEYTP